MGSQMVTQSSKFSSDCAPAERLRCILEEYRQKHYSRETPNHFKKDIIKAIKGPDECILVDDLNKILTNIGRPEAKLSNEELNILLRDAGSKDRSISIDKMMKLM